MPTQTKEQHICVALFILLFGFCFLFGYVLFYVSLAKLSNTKRVALFLTVKERVADPRAISQFVDGYTVSMSSCVMESSSATCISL